MKKAFFSLLIMVVSSNYFFSQTTRTVGVGGDYPNLSGAFSDINNGNIMGVIELHLISSFSESTTATLNASGTGSSSYSSILIFPTVAGVQVSGNLTGGLLVLDGADNVTLDGRVNQTCGIDLTFENTCSVSTLDNNTIRLQNSSENNIFQYTIVKGSNPFHSDAAGINPSGSIFRFAGSTSGNGNDNNLIEFCQFTNAGTVRPSSAIFSEGTAGFENSENQIRNCEFYNHLKLNPLNITSSAICVYFNSTNFTIQGNSFYETSSFGVQSGTPTTNGYSYIFVRNFPSGYVTIKDNFIGGSAPYCGDSPLTFTSSNAFPKSYNVRGINVIAGNTNLSLIENNTIKNITMEKTNYQYFGQFMGIYIQAGWCNVLNNTIGSQTELSIVLDNASSNSLSNSRSYGIEYLSCVAQDCNISGNRIGGIACRRTGDVINHHSFYGIEVTAGCGTVGNVYIRNNQIGSPTVANSILCEPLGSNTAILKQELLGIISNINSKNVFIDSNRVDNLTNLTTAGAGLSIGGIQCISAYATFSVNHNSIRNLTSYSSAVWDGTPNLMREKPVYGIYVWQPQGSVAPKTQYFRNNTITNLKNLNTTNFPAEVVGFYVWGKNASDIVNNYIEKNYISDLMVTPENTNSGSKIVGIFVDNAGISATNNIPSNPNFTNNINNNVISIGQTVAGDLEIYGIYDGNLNGNTGNFNFNTIVLGGSSPAGAVAKTYCVYRPSTTNGITNYSGTKTFQNNIFYNNRSVASGNNTLHHSAQVQFTSGLTMNYNDHWTTSTGSGNFLAQLVNTSYQGLSAWQTALSSGSEQNSLNLDPQFVNSSGGTLQSFTKSTVLNGFSGTSITTDALDSLRNTIPQMGAIENSVPLATDADGDGYVFYIDCDDQNAAIHPGNTDSADGLDNDCDGSIDEDAVYQWYYTDIDGDGYGTGTGIYSSMSPGIEYANLDGDCNDGNAAIHPNVNEDCTDGIDNNCNCIVDESTSQVTYYTDQDADGYGAGTGQILCYNPGVGYTPLNGDCNDNNPLINPVALEVCDSVDNNCDGQIDEDLPSYPYYVDSDGDGFGIGQVVLLCTPFAIGYSSSDGDCNDTNASIYPSAVDLPNNGIDENCDGVDGYLSVGELATEFMTLNPNPATNQTILKFAGNIEGMTITILSMKGEILRTIDVKGNETLIERGGLSSGIYLLKIVRKGELTGILKLNLL
jgi:hypothetical protein